MNKKYKQVLRKHVDIIKSVYPELYIAVIVDGDEIFISIDSQDISNEVKYEALICDFYEEYDSKGLGNIFWGVNSSLTSDNLHLLEDNVKAPNNVSNNASNKVSAKAYT